MSDNSAIEWTDATWNPVTGCDHVSPGCDNCYAERIATRFKRPFIGAVELHADRLDQPLRWRKPRRVFVNSVSDLFHKDVPDYFIAQVFAVMSLAQQHTFQVLTKRPQRMNEVVGRDRFPVLVDDYRGEYSHGLAGDFTWPLPNVWLGVSVENQRYADLRIPHLLATPAAVRFLSCEPLLGAIELREDWLPVAYTIRTDYGTGIEYDIDRSGAIDWVIVGGESGPGARPMCPQWARHLRDQCSTASVPFFFKQWGEYGCAPGGVALAWNDKRSVFVFPDTGTTQPCEQRLGMDRMRHPVAMFRVGKKAAGRELDGRTWDQFPDPITSVDTSVERGVQA